MLSYYSVPPLLKTSCILSTLDQTPPQTSASQSELRVKHPKIAAVASVVSFKMLPVTELTQSSATTEQTRHH